MTPPAPQHSRLSPSKSHTWTQCTAAIPFINANADRLPPDKAGPAAEEGTKAHTVAEYLLVGKEPPSYATPDMLRHGKAYAEFCRQTMGPQRDVYSWGVEYRAPLYYLKSERGTVDFYAATKNGLHLVDYKYGYHEVSSVENTQMAIYARSLGESLCDGLFAPVLADDSVITITIFQPRIGGEPVTWGTTWGELRTFTDAHITAKAASILSGDPGVFVCAPEVCLYCRAAPICDAYNASLLEDFAEEVEAVAVTGFELPHVSAISDERLVRIFANRDKLTNWIKVVEAFIAGRLKAGMKLPGVKLVMSKGAHRKWLDAEAAGKLLLSTGLAYDEVYPPSDVITPAQAEKLTDKMKGEKMIALQRMIVKPQGSPMAVLESDPRKPFETNLENDFAGENLEDPEFWG